MISLFYFFAALVLAFAAYAVLAPNLIRAVFSLFACLFCVSALYVFAQADFLAVAQVVVYVGGVLVVMLFGVMLSDQQILNPQPGKKEKKFKVSQLLVVLICVLLAWMLGYPWLNYQPEQVSGTVVNTISAIGIELLSGYLLPFEVLSILLLAVLIGVVIITRKGEKAL